MTTDTAPTPRANAERIITLNYGMGRDSTTMLMLAFEGRLYVDGVGNISHEDLDAVIFSDTGYEWDHTYALKPVIEEMCRQRGVRFVTLHKPSPCGSCGWRQWLQAKANGETTKRQTPFWVHQDAEPETKEADGSYHLRPPILDDYRSRNTVISLGKGDCTCNHKIGPIRRWINDLSMERFGLNNAQYSARVRRGERLPHITIIGIAADETSRIETPKARALRKLEKVHAAGTERIAKAEAKLAKAKTPKRRQAAVRRVVKAQAKFIEQVLKASAEATEAPDDLGGPDYVHEVYPLVDMGISKADEALTLTRWGLNHVRKSGCACCCYQPLSWYYALTQTDAKTWEAIVEYEQASLAANPNMNITGIKRGGVAVTLDTLVAEWRAANPDATLDAILEKSYRMDAGAAKKALRAALKTDAGAAANAA